MTTIDLDAGIRNNAGDAQIVALLLADELVGNSHMTCTVRDIAEAYLTKGAVAGRAVLRQEAACLDGDFIIGPRAFENGRLRPGIGRLSV